MIESLEVIHKLQHTYTHTYIHTFTLMKFGELIVQASDASTCLCAASDWFDYNGLKKLLDKIPKRQDVQEVDGENVDSECERAAAAKLGNCPEEKEFFIAVRVEMSKAVAVFNRLIRRETVMVAALLQSRGVRSPQGLEQCIRLHRNLCFLRNFAVMNYCGVKKILKKHDKVTGFKTQEKYMRKVVSRSVLAVHPSLTLAINQLETVYLEYTRVGTAGAAATDAKVQAANPATDDSRSSDSSNINSSNRSMMKSISAAAAGAEILAEFASAPVIRRGPSGVILTKRANANTNIGGGGAASSSSCQSDSNDEDDDSSSHERKRVKVVQ